MNAHDRARRDALKKLRQGKPLTKAEAREVGKTVVPSNPTPDPRVHPSSDALCTACKGDMMVQNKKTKEWGYCGLCGGKGYIKVRKK